MPDDSRPTVREQLNATLHRTMAADERIHVLGEDIADPYGGSFKVTRGLSTEFPGRVWSSPVSEAALVGTATGMALAGLRPIVEIMFCDFVTLCADQLINHAAKFPLMYGGEVTVPLLVRTAAGGGRGYGPTHSQTLEKLFLGVPGLSVAAISTHTDLPALVRGALDRSGPTVVIEHKRLYGRPMWTERAYRDDGWLVADVGDPGRPVRVLSLVPVDECDAVVVGYGIWAEDLLVCARELALRSEVFVAVVVVEDLGPAGFTGALDVISAVGRVVFVEESTAGSGWGAEMAYRTTARLGRRLRDAPLVLSSEPEVIPCGVAAERRTLLQPDEVVAAIAELAGG